MYFYYLFIYLFIPLFILGLATQTAFRGQISYFQERGHFFSGPFFRYSQILWAHGFFVGTYIILMGGGSNFGISNTANIL